MNVPHLLFADTSFYTALLFPGDAHHARALAWQSAFTQQGSLVLTTEPVLWELLNTFASTRTRRAVHEVYRRVHQARLVEVIDFHDTGRVQALSLYESH